VVRTVAQAAGVSETTVRKGVSELEQGKRQLPEGRVRKSGGGRKTHMSWMAACCRRCWRWWSRTSAADPTVAVAVTTKSLRHLLKS